MNLPRVVKVCCTEPGVPENRVLLHFEVDKPVSEKFFDSLIEIMRMARDSMSCPLANPDASKDGAQ